MLSCWVMLGASDDSFTQLAYVIGVLVIGGLSALAEKIKKMREESASRRPSEPRRPEPTADQRAPDIRRDPEVRRPPAEARPGPMTPAPPRRPSMTEAPPLPPRRPVPARQPTKARPVQMAEPTPARPPALGGVVASRKVGGEVGKLGKKPSLADDVQQSIERMKSESIVTSVSSSSPKISAAPVAVATLVGPLSKMSTADLRRAFVMSEVFQPPLALRQ